MSAQPIPDGRLRPQCIIACILYPSPSKKTNMVRIIGMRGSGDTALGSGIETALLENVVAAQTQILNGLWGNESVSNPDIVPQMWCLYKEVQG